MKKVLNFQDDNTILIKDVCYTKEKFSKMYIEQNMSLKELQSFLGLSEGSVLKIIKFFNLKKDTALSQENLRKTLLEEYGVSNVLKLKEFRDKGKDNRDYKYLVGINSKYPGQEFNNYYQGHTQKECAEYFKVSVSAIQNWVKKYGIKKAKAQKPRKVKKTKEELSKIHKLAYSKTEQTNLERYGVKTTLLNPETMEKIKKSVLEKYGCENVAQSDIIKQRVREKNLIKYGTNVPHQSKINNFQYWEKDESFTDFIKNLEPKKTIFELSKFFNITYSAIEKRIIKLNLKDYIVYMNGSSVFEQEIYQMLLDLGLYEDDIILHDRSVLNGQEIDLYLPKYKFGIEFNGNFWHCELQEKFQDHNGRSVYHQNKSLRAQEAGIFLFHIFEYEWDNPTVKEQIKNRISSILKKNRQIIGARKCKVIVLDKAQKKHFLNENHIQGNDSSQIALGLMRENEIVACMTFKKPKYKKYNYELSRFCCKNYYSIPGAANKLFKYYINNYCQTGDVIVSYNDITKTKGDIYRILNFEMVSINAPNYVWFNFKNCDLKTRYQTQHKKEVSVMHEQDYYRICDCGTKTWIYCV